MDISIIGTGYVGLTTGIALAELGNKVVLVDVVPEKLEAINKGKAPFYEPLVDDLLAKHIDRGNITTTLDGERAVRETDITFISVGTPSKEDGSMDDSYIRAASETIGKALKQKDDFHVVVMKSTVVPGTTMGVIRETIENVSGLTAVNDVGIAMCPEFLREGAAMHDSMNPDRIVIGCIDDRSFGILKDLFDPLGSKILRTSPESAEMIKYASNSLLATKISFANEISRICERVGVDVYEIMEGVGMDFRISPQFLRAGVGFGGSCFPKDVSALMDIAKGMGVETPILDGVMQNNEIQPNHLVAVAEELAGGLRGKKVAVLGLSFKPDTDDIRYSRSIPVIQQLIKMGSKVIATDPKAIENFKVEVPDIEYNEDPEIALEGAQVVFLMTEWPVYKQIDWEGRSSIEVVVDGRRSIDPRSMKNIKYWSIGKPLP